MMIFRSHPLEHDRLQYARVRQLKRPSVYTQTWIIHDQAVDLCKHACTSYTLELLH